MGRPPGFAIAFAFFIGSAGAAAAEPVRDPDRIYLPASVPAGEKLPLVVLLHAFKVSGGFQKAYFGLGKRARARRFILFVPGSTRDERGNRFWNAMPYWSRSESSVDDVAHLKEAIENVIAKNPVDPDRVYLLGHSNGAMMAHRMACEHADLFAAAASLAGAGMPKASDCKPSSPVSFLEVHALRDAIVPYGGMDEARLAERLKSRPLYPYSEDPSRVRYPSAPETTANWARLDGCDVDAATEGPRKNYVVFAPGKETRTLAWEKGCRGGTSVALWTLMRGGHVPRFFGSFNDAIVDFLLARRKIRD